MYFVCTKSKIESMKALLPVLFFTFLCTLGFANKAPLPAAGKAPATAAVLDFNAYHDNNYDSDGGYMDSVGCMSKTFYFQDDCFFIAEVPTSYDWDFGDGGTETTTSNQTFHNYSSPGIYSVILVVHTNKGKTYTITKTNYITIGSSFTVNPGNDTTICGKTPHLLDVTTAGATYLWSTGETTPAITDSLGGNYSVTVERQGCQATGAIQVTRTILSVDLGPDQDLCDGNYITLSGGNNPGADYLWSTGESTPDIDVWDGGPVYVDVTKGACKVSDTVMINWKPGIINNFGFEKVSGCLPVDYKFTDSSSVCSGTITGWLWDFGDGGTSTAQNPTHTFTSKAQFTVRLKVFSSNGSSSTRTKKVTVDPPTVSVDLGPDTTICFGESIIFDAANPGATYTWSTGETTQQIEVMDDGTYSVVVDMGGCIGKDTVKVVTSAPAIANFGAAVGGNCLPISVSFSDSSIAKCGKAVTGWKWTFGDGGTSTEQNPTHVYTTSDSFNVKLMITITGGTTATKVKKVKVINSTFSVDLPEELKVCHGASVGLDAGVNGAVYSWTPAVGLSAADVRNPTLTPLADGLYKVSVTKCSVTQSDSVYIKMDSIEVPMIVQQGNTLNAPDGESFQWYYEGKLMNGVNTQSIRVDRAGYYSLAVTNTHTCVNKSEEYFYVPVSHNEKIESFRMKLSPNPTNGVFNILFSQIPAKPAKVSVYDAAGKRLLVTTVSDHVNKVDASKFLKGLYFVEIIINNQRTIMPLAIQ